jgi:hypothetical protein
MKDCRLNIRIQRVKHYLVAGLFTIFVISFFLFIIPRVYGSLGLIVTSGWVIGLFIISDNDQYSLTRHRRQNLCILILFLFFILFGSSAVFRFAIDDALRPPLTYSDTQNSPIPKMGFSLAEENYTDSPKGTQFNVSLSVSFGISDSVSTSSVFQITLSEVLSTSSVITLDTSDQYYLVLYDAANNSFKNFHAFSKKHVKRIIKRIRKKTKKLKRLEQSDDKRPALKEYIRLVDEVLFLEKILR